MLTAATRLDALARLGKALADPTRCRILIALLEGPAYPAGLADRLGLTRSNVSNHLACLRGCGLVVTIDQGRQTRYEIADPRLAHAIDDLLGVVLAVNPTEHCRHTPHGSDPAKATSGDPVPGETVPLGST